MTNLLKLNLLKRKPITLCKELHSLQTLAIIICQLYLKGLFRQDGKHHHCLRTKSVEWKRWLVTYDGICKLVVKATSRKIRETRTSFEDLRAISFVFERTQEGSRTKRGRKRKRDGEETIEEERRKHRVWVKEYFVIPVAAREYQNGKRLASINHVYSGPMSQVTVIHYVNARVHPLFPFPLTYTRIYTLAFIVRRFNR